MYRVRLYFSFGFFVLQISVTNQIRIASPLAATTKGLNLKKLLPCGNGNDVEHSPGRDNTGQSQLVHKEPYALGLVHGVSGSSKKKGGVRVLFLRFRRPKSVLLWPCLPMLHRERLLVCLSSLPFYRVRSSFSLACARFGTTRRPTGNERGASAVLWRLQRIRSLRSHCGSSPPTRHPRDDQR